MYICALLCVFVCLGVCVHKYEVQQCMCVCASIVFEYETTVMDRGVCRHIDMDRALSIPWTNHLCSLLAPQLSAVYIRIY